MSDLLGQSTGSNMVDPKLYTYRVIWSAEDGELVGLCAESARPRRTSA